MNREEDKFIEKMLIFSIVVMVVTGAYFLNKAPKSIAPPLHEPSRQAYSGFFSSSSGHSGGSSATKAAMQNIKTALVNYNNDLGFFPHIGKIRNPKTYYLADEPCLGASMTWNVLVASDVGVPFEWGGIASTTYSRRWKGPYMDCDPSEFMSDAWDRKIIYTFFRDAIYLHSAGPNGNFDPLDIVTATSYGGDDIIMSVSKLKSSRYTY